MEELNNILNEILSTYNKDLTNDEKHQEVSKLWTKYYKYANEHNLDTESGYNMYLLLENESYIIDQKPLEKEIDKDKLNKSLLNLKEVQQNNELNLNDGLNSEDAKLILDYAVQNARNNFKIMGINLETNSLNGFCEISQALTIMPLESVCLKVTKNTATDAFDYPWNHCFGTVTIPILENGKKEDKTYLIDATFRQFFSTVRCNEGRYYTKEENTYLDAAPDPGYFIKDEAFARELLKDGYIELTKENANIYGTSFYKASLTKSNKDKEIKNNYYEQILKTSSNYKVNENELEGLNVSFPKIEEKYKTI